MTAVNGVSLAKQGNAQAIAALINKSLQPKGITVTATTSGSCLNLVAEAQTAPDQAEIVDFIRKGIENLKPSSIDRIAIQGRVIGQKQSAWRELVELSIPQSPTSKGLKTTVLTKPAQTEKIGQFGWITYLKDYANTLLLGGILLTLLVGGWNANHSDRQLWEYKVEGIDDAVFDIRMQQAGADGWELASARRAISGEGESSEGLYEVIFKRRITAAQARQNLKDVTAKVEEQGL